MEHFGWTEKQLHEEVTRQMLERIGSYFKAKSKHERQEAAKSKATMPMHPSGAPHRRH